MYFKSKGHWVGRVSDSNSVSQVFEPHQRVEVNSLSKKTNPHCLVLVGSRFELDLHELNDCFTTVLK